jgi:hypothetical protein
MRWLASILLPHLKEQLMAQLLEELGPRIEGEVARYFSLGRVQLVHSETMKALLDVEYTLFATGQPGTYMGYLDLSQMGQGERLTVRRFIRLAPDGPFVPFEEEEIEGYQRAPVFLLPALYAPQGMRAALKLTGGNPRSLTSYWFRVE